MAAFEAAFLFSTPITVRKWNSEDPCPGAQRSGCASTRLLGKDRGHGDWYQIGDYQPFRARLTTSAYGKITWEVYYDDYLALMPVDHPVGTESYGMSASSSAIELGFTTGDPETQQAIATRQDFYGIEAPRRQAPGYLRPAISGPAGAYLESSSARMPQ